MKREFPARPDAITDEWCRNAGGFAWQDFLTGIPAPVFVVTGWKANKKENACLQSWAAFVGAGTDDFICIIPKVPKYGHMYKSLKETGVCVLNFPSKDVYSRCVKTIGNNGYDADEITAAGLTAEKSFVVDAPRIAECFLNIECEFLWERELIAGSEELTVALRAVGICMDEDRFDEKKLGRYGKTGYLFQIHCPTDPDTGEVAAVGAGTIEPCEIFEWLTK